MPTLSRLNRIFIAVFASLSLGGTLVVPVASATRTAKHKRKTKRKVRKKRCVIPQRNGGDRDQDNNGGPSDGDGCV